MAERQKLTPGREKVLVFLRSRLKTGDRTPASAIGNAMDDGQYKGGYGLTSQGAGRLGGRMAAMLIREGMAASVSSDGWPNYRITPKGLAAIAHIPEGRLK